jgi:hypothetical protein
MGREGEKAGPRAGYSFQFSIFSTLFPFLLVLNLSKFKFLF